MLYKNLFLAFALSSLGLAQEIDNGDVPSQCSAVCSAVVTLARDCDRQHDDDDRAELDCICQASNANTQIPICEACVAEFDNDGRDNDINDLLRDCNFSTTTYNPSAASASVTASSGASSNSLGIATSAPASTTGSAGSSETGTGTAAQNPSQTTGAAASESTGAAAIPTMNVEAAGLAMGAIGLVLGAL